MEGAVFPPSGQTMVGVMAASFERTCAGTIVFSAPTLQQATVDSRLCRRLPDTHREVWLTLLEGHCSFFLGPDAHKVLLCPPRVGFLSPGEVLSSNPTGLQSQIPWRFSFCLIPRFGNLLWTLELMQQCKNFSGIIVLQFVGRLRQLYCGANDNLLQEDFCHTPRLPGLLQPEPLSLCRPLLTASAGDTQTQSCLALSLWGHWVLVHTNWKTIIRKTFSHCYKNSKMHNRFSNVGIWQRD